MPTHDFTAGNSHQSPASLVLELLSDSRFWISSTRARDSKNASHTMGSKCFPESRRIN